mmetsp:Transcript_20699/g.29644  ORF Transcript_20699/g.29644 Transcript_20699/m.29644 type:complete len:201 (+) Transcript_20699:1000-1602(+)
MPEATLLKGKTHPYTTKHDIVRSQNKIPNLRKSVKRTSSASEHDLRFSFLVGASSSNNASVSSGDATSPLRLFSFFTALPSTNTISAAANKDENVSIDPIQNAVCIPPRLLATFGDVMLLNIDPSRDTESPIPIAKATSLPSNQSDVIVDCATHSDSAPSPKTNLPKYITSQLLLDTPLDKRIDPQHTRDANAKRHCGAP